MLALEGIRVLDLSQVGAVPSSGMYLADQGADVIKVEPPTGDILRTMFTRVPIAGEARSHLVINRNKRGIVVDLRTEEGKQIIHKIVKVCDVVIQNFRATARKEFGVDYETLRVLNPRLIYVAFTPYGPLGPVADRPGFDLIAQAYSGLLSLLRMPDGTPISPAVWIADMSAPMLICYGVMCALWMREKTGRGQKVETSLLQAAIAMQLGDIVKGEGEGEEAEEISYAVQAVWTTYRCRDGKFLQIAAAAEHQWVQLCKTLGVEELLTDLRFKTTLKRAENSEVLRKLLSKAFRQRSRDEWVELLQRDNVPSAPVLSRGEVYTYPQMTANRFFCDIDHPVAGRTTMMNTAVRLSESSEVKMRPSPRLGEHTREVLLEVGYREEEIREFEGKGIIVCWPP
jgi:crotonobetainyl-CoA:carnitine CoA-transferase CaiB-like acyl-CoA transferase